MKPAALPPNDSERLHLLQAMHLRVGPADPALVAIARLASRHTGCPVGAIGAVDAERQWFLASLGLPIAELPRELSFCAQAILDDAGLVVADARHDPRFTASPLLAIEPPIAFYAGVPIRVGGCRIASVCVMDHRPRTLSGDQLGALRDLAAMAGALLDARLGAGEPWPPARGEGAAGCVEPAGRAGGEPTLDTRLLDASPSGLVAVLQAMPDPWFVLDADGRYLACSDAEPPSLLRPYAELHGRDFRAGLPAPLGERGVAARRDALESGAVQRFECELACRDGVLRSCEARVSPMGGGQTLFVLRDLTERRQREREAPIIQRALEAEAAPPICIADATQPDLPLIYVNPAFERLTGYQRDAVLGHNCRLLQGEYSDQPGLATLRAALADGSACKVTLLNQHRDGSNFVNELHVAPVHDAGGRLSHFIGMQIDVTRRSQVAEALALSEELYRSVAAAISDGLVVTGADGSILATNPAACEILGVDANRLIGSRLGSLDSRLLFEDGSEVPDADHPVRSVRLGGPGQIDRVHILRRSDGSQRTVRLSARPLTDLADGQPRACLVTFSDITRQRAAEQALRDRQAAELANRAKSEFLSRVSHEMRTPLNAVIGFTQLLRLAPGGSAPAQVAQYTEHVLRASEHLLALINDLLDLQRVDEGRLALQLRPLGLSTLIGATFELLQSLARQHGVALQSQVDGDAWVRADAQRLRQVLINIVANAIKYNRAGGWVCISLLPGDEQHWVLAVEDTGSGLTQDELARLFQPFERLGHESSDIEGSGLGLVIARRLVEEMGGELTLSSVPASGTLVRIALPRAEAPPTARVGAAPMPPTAGGANAPAPPEAESAPPALRMLYVEDNRINAILFEEAVRMRGGVELQVAEDGAEALALVRHWQPEVLVLDANLPDMSGYDVLARLRKLPALAGVPAFMCSADAMDEDVQRATAAGFVGYWTKPIDIARVMSDLDRLLPRRAPR